MLHLNGIAELAPYIGRELGASDWLTITQERIDLFADSSGDHQWIHVDPVRAAEGPYGATIAHGFLTLSLLPLLSGEVFTVGGLRMTVNYGLERVRFPAPVPVDSRVRNRVELVSLTPARAGVQALIRHTIELEGSERPACVADQIRLLVE